MDNMDDKTYLKYIKQLTRDLLYITCIVLIPTGVAFNSISIVVFSQKKLRKQMMSFYYIVLAILDLLVLAVYFISFYYFTLGIDITLVSTLMCKLFSYLFRVTTQLTSWWQLFMTIDRAFLVKYPKRFKMLKKRRTLCALLACLLATLTLVNFANFVFEVADSGSTFSSDTNKTTHAIVMIKMCKTNTIISLIRDSLSQLFRTIIPYVLMIIFNFLLIRTVLNSKKRLGRCDKAKREYYFAFSLIANNVIYFVALSPLLASLLVLDYYKFVLKMAPNSREMAKIILIHNITVYLALLDNILPFLSHVMFNKLFRLEFFNMIKKFNGKI
jgi:hypothetical protein